MFFLVLSIKLVSVHMVLLPSLHGLLSLSL
jgi:hypothetical protein